jgi:hypothetical protein
MIRGICTGVLILLGAGGGLGAALAQPPPAVSPGAPGSFAEIADRCPTFSWGGVPQAQSYELIVYPMAKPGTPGREAEVIELEPPVLRRIVPGTALAWTPALDECLSPGTRYAWSVRATGEEAPAEWSEARLFQVLSAPSIAEVEAALAVLHEYVAAAESSPGGEQAEGNGKAVETPTAIEGEPIRLDSAAGAPVSDALALLGFAAIRGEQNDPGGETYGVHGITASSGEGSSGLVGEATSSSGGTRGVVGQVKSVLGIAGVFENTAGGQIFSGRNNSAEVFSVEGDGQVLASGDVMAQGFVGDGSQLSSVPVDWSDVTGIPAGFADEVDDDTTYSAGNQLGVAGTTVAVWTPII